MCQVLDGGGFAKNISIPVDLSRLFGDLDPQKIGADRDKNRSVQVKITSRFLSD